MSMGFSRQEDKSGWPFPSPGDFPDPGTEPGSPAWQTDSLPSGPLVMSDYLIKTAHGRAGGVLNPTTLQNLSRTHGSSVISQPKLAPSTLPPIVLSSLKFPG